MGEFLKPLRRKIGVAIMVIACVFMCGWFRSFTISEVVSVPVSPASMLSVGSVGNHFLLLMSQYHVREARPKKIEWNQINEFQTVESLFHEHSLDFRFLGFGLIASNDTFNGGLALTIPYVLLVSSLTLLSAWLLLSKPNGKRHGKIDP